MKIAVSFYSYYRPWKAGKLDVPAFVAEAKRIGGDGVELLDYHYADAALDRVIARDALAEAGMPCPIFSVGNNLVKVDADERKRQVDRIVFGIGEAEFYGAGVVRVFAGDVGEGVTFDQAREWIVTGLAEASKVAHSRGIRLALENHGTLAGRGDQVAGLIRDVRRECGNDALGANPDLGNFVLVNQDSPAAVAEVAEFANMGHFKDFRPAADGEAGTIFRALDGQGFMGTVIGEGVVDLEACLAKLRAAEFDGWLSVEYEGDEDAMVAVPRSVANARRLI